MDGFEIKYSKHFQHKLEDLFAETDYMLRYEKGTFNAGYCIIHDKKIILINKYYALEGKINCLIEILRVLPISIDVFSEKNKDLYLKLSNQN